MTFSWGRRVCSRQALAEQGTFITVARSLWGFRFDPALDEHRNVIPVDIPSNRRLASNVIDKDLTNQKP